MSNPSNVSRPLIEARQLGMQYGRGQRRVAALSDVSFSLHAGEAVAVTGPSGSGKSTLLALLGGFLLPTDGDCLVGGQSLRGMDDHALSRYRGDTLGFVFQQFCLLPHLTLLDNILLGVDHLPAEHAQWKARAEALLSKVGLDGLGTRLPSEVSGGQAQRAAIARALLRGPRLLLADEPTGSLDAETTSDILQLLLQCCSEGCALVLVTHSEIVAAAMPRQLQLKAGRLVAERVAEPG